MKVIYRSPVILRSAGYCLLGRIGHIMVMDFGNMEEIAATNYHRRYFSPALVCISTLMDAKFLTDELHLFANTNTRDSN